MRIRPRKSASGARHGAAVKAVAQGASVERAVGAGGRPLEATVRQEMEQRLGHDFSRVRIHTDVQAQESLYISSGAPDAERQFQDLMAGFGRIPFFCINDTSDDAVDDAPQLQNIARTLGALLPNPSSFERID